MLNRNLIEGILLLFQNSKFFHYIHSPLEGRLIHVCVCVCVCACVCMCVCVLVAWWCSTLCNPIYCSPPGPSIHGILQARTLKSVAISFSKRNYRKKESELTQSCPTLCDPMDCSLPGSSIHGIFQAQILEQVVISFSS